MKTWNSDFSIPESNSFHGIRLICCLDIIIEHYLTLINYQGYIPQFRSVAVAIFFSLSGFWVWQSACNSRNWKDFFKKRIRKIMPQYSLVIIGCGLLLSIVSIYTLPEYFHSKTLYKYFIANLLFLNFACPSLPGVFDGAAVNGSLWTLKIEIAFYALVPLLFLFSNYLIKDKKESCKFFFNKIVLTVFLIDIVLSYVIIYIVNRYNLPNQLRFQIQWFLPLFLGGILCAENLNQIKKGSTFFVLCAIIISALYFVFKLPYTWPFSCLSISFLSIWAGINYSFFSFLKSDYTYALYLVHYPIIMVLRDGDLFKHNILFGISLTVIITVAFALQLNKFQSWLVRNF